MFEYSYSVRIYPNLLPFLEQELKELGIDQYNVERPIIEEVDKTRYAGGILYAFVYFLNDSDFHLWKLSSHLLTPGWDCGINITKHKEVIED